MLSLLWVGCRAEIGHRRPAAWRPQPDQRQSCKYDETRRSRRFGPSARTSLVPVRVIFSERFAHSWRLNPPTKRQLTVSLQGLTVGFIKHEAAAQTAVRNKSTTPPGRDKGGGYAAIVALKYMDA